MKHQKGQAVIEALLIITLLFAVVLIISGQFNDEEYLVQLVEGPWQNLSGLIQNGTWGSVDETMNLHPSGYERHISLEGEAP